MMKKRLSESVEIMLTADPNIQIMTDNMISEWGGTSYPEISVALVHLKYLAALHQNHHWTAIGDPYYGDHLLFERLYGETVGEIDTVAEKAIGLGSTHNVDLHLQYHQLLKLIVGHGSGSTMPQASELARKSLIAEMNFLLVMKHLCDCLKDCGTMTHGLDNMLAGIEDKHEGHVYLLKQRISNPLV